MAVSIESNHSPSALRLFVAHGVLARIWFVWRGMSDLYLSLLFGFSAGLAAASLTFLLPAWPGFWSFLGSAVLAGGLGGGGVISSVGLGCCKAVRFPSFFEVVSCRQPHGPVLKVNLM